MSTSSSSSSNSVKESRSNTIMADNNASESGGGGAAAIGLSSAGGGGGLGQGNGAGMGSVGQPGNNGSTVSVDRITQLQDRIAQMAEMFFNSLGVLKAYNPVNAVTPPPATAASVPSQQQQQQQQQQQPPPSAGMTQQQYEEFAQVHANLIVKTAKEIDLLIDSLPDVHNLEDEKELELFEKLQQQNAESAEMLRGVVREAEVHLSQVTDALHTIAVNQLQQL